MVQLNRKQFDWIYLESIAEEIGVIDLLKRLRDPRAYGLLHSGAMPSGSNTSLRVQEAASIYLDTAG
jgi:hypothetical protein